MDQKQIPKGNKKQTLKGNKTNAQIWNNHRKEKTLKGENAGENGKALHKNSRGGNVERTAMGKKERIGVKQTGSKKIHMDRINSRMGKRIKKKYG